MLVCIEINAFFFLKKNKQNQMNLELNTNEDTMLLQVAEVNKKIESIKEGGGKKAIAKQHEKNKLTARERIAYLLDKNTEWLELGTFAGYDMYPEYGGCPAGGTVSGIGYISNRLCMIVANDQTVKAGAWFPITGKKNLRMQEIALENNLPIVYIVDSAGVFLPLQDEIFPDKEHFGRIFRNNAQMSAKGITQIAAVMGPCVAGGAYLPIMSDETIMVEQAGSIFLAGPYLVKAAIGEDVDAEILGGAHTHTHISGIADYSCATEQLCLDKVKAIVAKISVQPTANFSKSAFTYTKNVDEIVQHFPAHNAKPYNVLHIINYIIDDESFIEYKADYGKSIVCGYATLQGWAVGIVANQRTIVKNAKGEMQIGGVIYNDSADKAARFIMNCNQKKVPLIFLQDVTGFMVGSKSEHSGIIKDGAKLVNAVANSIVPKFTIITGNSYGAGNYAMCGKAYDPRFIFAWPTSKIAVMGGDQAAKTLLQIQVASLKAKGDTITEEKELELLNNIKNQYAKQTTPYYAAARLWVDDIIDPRNTRKILAQCLHAANHQAQLSSFAMGVVQV